MCCCPSVGVVFWGGAWARGCHLTWGVRLSDHVSPLTHQVLQWAWHEIKGEAMALDYSSGIVLTVGLEERQCRRPAWVAPLTQAVRWAVVFAPILVLWVLCAFWDCLWTSGGLPVASQLVKEKGSPWGRGWCCCWCVLSYPFQSGFRSMEYIIGCGYSTDTGTQVRVLAPYVCTGSSHACAIVQVAVSRERCGKRASKPKLYPS